MKIRKFLFQICFFSFAVNSSAQLKVHPNGLVSIGTLSSFNGYKLTVEGYSAIAVKNGSDYMRFSAAAANSVIGTNADRVAFWESSVGHHQIDASTFHVTSDSSLKTQITPLSTEPENLMLLKTYSYYFKDEERRGLQKKHFGFLAQEIQKVFPFLVDSSMGVLVMNYDEIIPLLVRGYQKQQNTITSLLERVEALEQKLNKLQTSDGLSNPGDKLLSKLEQNKPNPFHESTVIEYSLASNYSTASIMIFDLNGSLLQTYPITNRYEGKLTIDGNSFKPGMYLYSLIVDDIEVDTKKMILQ